MPAKPLKRAKVRSAKPPLDPRFLVRIRGMAKRAKIRTAKPPTAGGESEHREVSTTID